jgi:hypothetical protein
MTILPLAVYVIALSGALSSEEGGIMPAVFAIGALLTAEIAWQVVKWSRRFARNTASG